MYNKGELSVFMCKCLLILLLGTYPIMYMQTMYNHEMHLGGAKQQHQRLDAKAWAYDDFWGYNMLQHCSHEKNPCHK